MKPLNKNLAYDCSNLSEEEMKELMMYCKLKSTPIRIFYDLYLRKWLHSCNFGNFTDAKTLFE